MKKSIFQVPALALCLTLLSSAVAPKSSEALIIERVRTHGSLDLEGLWNSDEYYSTPFGGRPIRYPFSVFVPVATLGCMLILPICILNEKAPGTSSSTVAHLKANGYSDDEIATIMSDQQKLVSALATKSMELKIGPNDTAESLGKEIREAAPGISDVYVNHLTGSVGL